MAGSTPAISPIWTTRATSASTAASRTSSSAAARTCRSSRSRICCSNIRRCWPRRWSVIPIDVSGNAPARSSCCVRAIRSISRPSRTTWPRTRSPSNIGRNASRSSPTCPRRPAGKVQKFQLREQAKGFGDVGATGERMNARLQDRICVVTGAARGIGLAIAERFGREGARLACVDVSARRLEPAVEGLKAKGFETRGYAVDVGKRDDVHAMFARIESEFAAPVAVVVNNAVWARFQPLAEIDGETADAHVRGRRAGAILDDAGGGAADGAARRRLHRQSEFRIRLSSGQGLDRLFRAESGRRRPLPRGRGRTEPEENPRQRDRAGHDRHARLDRAIRRDDHRRRGRPRCRSGASASPRRSPRWRRSSPATTQAMCRAP